MAAVSNPAAGQSRRFHVGYADLQSQITVRNSLRTIHSPPRPNPYDLMFSYNASIVVASLLLVGVFVAILILAFCGRKHAVQFNQYSDGMFRTAAADAERLEGGAMGLDGEFLERFFPIMTYSSGSAQDHVEVGGKLSDSMQAIRATDCAVCLMEFEEGESVRLLPKCSHLFHAQCIDEWLASNTTCPLCRISLAAYAQLQPVVADAATSVEELVMTVAELADSSPAGGVVEAVNHVAASENIIWQENSSGIQKRVVRALSRSSQSFRKAVQLMQQFEMRKRLAATSWKYEELEESSPSSKWRNKLRRSQSMKADRASASASKALITHEFSAGDAASAASSLQQRSFAEENHAININIAEKHCARYSEGSSSNSWPAKADTLTLSRNWKPALRHSISLRQTKGSPRLSC